MNRTWLFLLVFWGSVVVVLPGFSQDEAAEELGEGFDKPSALDVYMARWRIHWDFWDQQDPQSLSEEEKSEILSRYGHLDPKREVPQDLLESIVLYFDLHKAKFPNRKYISIVDFSLRSDRQRFFIIDMNSGGVEKYWTTHGIGSDRDDDGMAERFSNVVNSGSSSVGFVRTAETYSGRFKYSLRLDGLSATNSKVRERAIVVHGWDYVKEAPLKHRRSWGCPALDWKVKDAVIEKIKEGSLMLMAVSKR